VATRDPDSLGEARMPPPVASGHCLAAHQAIDHAVPRAIAKR